MFLAADKRAKSGLWAAWLWLVAVVISGCDAPTDPLRLVDLDGRQLDTQGQLVLINYWAEWCKPCREEIPELNQFARQQHGKVRVVGVNFEQLPAAETRAQAKKLGITFPTLQRDPSAYWGQPRPTVLPSTLLIDADGHWQATLVGPQTEQSLQAAIAAVDDRSQVKVPLQEPAHN